MDAIWFLRLVQFLCLIVFILTASIWVISISITHNRQHSEIAIFILAATAIIGLIIQGIIMGGT